MEEFRAAQDAAAARRWSFGAVVLDERSMRLFVAGRAVGIELKPLELLRHLLCRAGEAVSKDDLVRAVWPGRVISDSALTSTIAKLREALGEDAGAIQTVHGFGYRLDAEVRTAGAGGRDATGDSAPATPSRRLAAIMFTDLVGYSALANKDEALAIELLEQHRAWVREILPRHGGHEIETVGDAFLIEFSGALAAVECALAIQRRFADHNATQPAARRMELRIGIHLGDVEHRAGKLMGDGVNIASRIHGVAEPGGICVSEPVYHAVRNRPGFDFAPLGPQPLKNIATPLELYRLGVPAAAAAAAPPAATMPRWTFRRRYAVPVVVAVALGGLAVGFWSSRPPAATPSVAVLPFENLSAEPDSAYFTDGLHDTVIGNLGRIRDLKVISRTSVMGYRGKQSNLRQIARELDVAHIVEGSVQRSGNRLRVVAQLIDTATDTHVWSSEYNRDLSDVFAVQADIASQVARAVHAQLSPEERAQIARVPTQDPQAYDLYLRAVLVDRRFDLDPNRFRDAIAWLEQAVALDPQFAHAYALLADMHDRLAWFGHDTSPARREQVTRNAEQALRIAPDLAEAHVAKAIDLYHGAHDYDGALRELEIARQTAPGNARVLYWAAPVYRRQGRWDEALVALERATTIDPLNQGLLREHAFTLVALRRFAEAEALFVRIAGLASDDPLVKAYRAANRFNLTGDLDAYDAVLEAVPAGFDPNCEISGARRGVALYRRQFERAAQLALSCEAGVMPANFFAALAYWLGQDTARAMQQARKARARMEATEVPEDVLDLELGLAFIDVIEGNKDAARRRLGEIRQSRRLRTDALGRAGYLYYLAITEVALGNVDQALRDLEESLRLPGGAFAQDLRLDPHFDALRGDPRFEKLIAELLPRP